MNLPTDYLGAVLNPTALVGRTIVPTPDDFGSVRGSELPDWILYLATALFVVEVLVCASH